jgi:hypothetical protein
MTLTIRATRLLIRSFELTAPNTPALALPLPKYFLS